MLKSEKVTIRAISEADLDLIAKWRSDPSVYDYFYEYLPISPTQQRRWYEQQLGRKDELNFSVDDADGKLIGTVSIYHIDVRNRKAEWGRLIVGSKESRGKGIGKEIERLILQYSFAHLNLHKLYCEVIATNASVIALHKTFGFEQEGVLREHVFKNGKYVDVIVMSLLEERYFQEKA